MENYGTEIGLGVAAFFTTVIAWFKLKPKAKTEPEIDMTSVLKRISNLEGGQQRMNDSIKALIRETSIHITNTQDDVKEVKSDIKDVKDILLEVQKVTSRLEGRYEAESKRDTRS